MLALTIDTSNLPPLDRFPEYSDPFEDILSHTTHTQPQPPIMTSNSPKPKPAPLVNIQGEDQSRGASPQPTHFSVPLRSHNNGNGHRILRSATVGYVAPEFTGKVEQMKTGTSTPDVYT